MKVSSDFIKEHVIMIVKATFIYALCQAVKEESLFVKNLTPMGVEF